ncbi:MULTISPECIES: hypothetical protein [Roseomonadaceae]|uniref:Uncharacterized protein n=1 Tax=Falsiroseomonas oleicola TaxID=2801474 RepID=A0ABS6HCJ9_9PROT|nr:hypothetical protein [Roseomonas oleicola]MBU8546452.1 hypothetical protein [Roseomonas oleicola]
MPSDTTQDLPPKRHAAPPVLPPSQRNPFNPRVPTTQRPIFHPEEGESRGDGLAAAGSGLIVLAVAGVLAWLVYLTFGG